LSEAQILPGDRVRHAMLGAGSVLALVPGGKARVRFDQTATLPRTIALLELDRSSRGAPTAAEGAKAPLRHAPPDYATVQALEARQAIEALRLGVVPATCATEYTVARETELAAIDDLLHARTGLRLVWGDYGAGKTHLLEVAESIARDRGFVTSRVILHPEHLPPTHPQRLYQAIVQNLRYPEDAGLGYEPLFQRLAESRQHRSETGTSYSRFLSPVLYGLGTEDTELAGWISDYIEGANVETARANYLLSRAGWRGDRLLAMSDFRTYGRMYVHILGAFASWIREAGWRGLVILFDEVEMMDQLDAGSHDYAEEVLRHYAAATLPREELAFDIDGLYKGGHEVHRSLPLRYADDQPLMVVYALTPLDEIKETVRGMVTSDRHEVTLRPLDARDCTVLVDKISTLYARAYAGWRPDGDVLARMKAAVIELAGTGHAGMRAGVRGTIAHLDQARLMPRQRLERAAQ
jgi:hypothetical protein